MADIVTQEERDLIDAAVAASRAQERRAPNVRPAPYVWTGKKLESREGSKTYKQMVQGQINKSFARKRHEDRLQRDKAIAAYLRQCDPATACADAMREFGYCKQKIETVARDHGIRLVTRQELERQALTDKIVAQVDGVRTAQEIAAIVGCHRGTVLERRAQFGLDIPSGPFGPRGPRGRG